MNDVLGIAPPPPKVEKSPVIIGLIPCWNRFFLDPAWTVVRPGVQEIAQISPDEFDAQFVWQQIYTGQFQLYLSYIDRTGTATEDRFQEMFVEKLRKPEVDFAGFAIIDVMRRHSIHVFGVYIMPEFRGKNLWDLGVDYIERQIKSIGAKCITSSVQPYALEAMKRRGYEAYTMNVRKNI
ncbi:MAG: hypothetical protein E4G97_00795 [Deltaproteobacteria bacterium]|nr:MAG: hypothetical protein E4G97_00795 [Deltaproteobacteria bacterium]